MRKTDSNDMGKFFGCHARQYSDQMVCHECDLACDMNDYHPPLCGKSPTAIAKRDRLAARNKAVTTIKRLLGMGG